MLLFNVFSNISLTPRFCGLDYEVIEFLTMTSLSC